MIMLNLDLMWTGSSVCEGGSGGIQAIKSIAEDSVDLSLPPVWNAVSAHFDLLTWTRPTAESSFKGQKPFKNSTDRIFKNNFVCKSLSWWIEKKPCEDSKCNFFSLFTDMGVYAKLRDLYLWCRTHSLP